ncbi:HAD-like domain-containing protein [Mycena amicta]|nr:HAD-like domain-containing protein [Mycena amicta]
MLSIEYVLFDLDGLLIDTENLWSKVTDTILAPYGEKVTWEIKAGCMGKHELASATHLLSCLPSVQLTPEAFLLQLNALQDSLWHTVSLLPGAHKLLAHLSRHNVPIALATSSRRTKFERKTAHLQETFALFAGRVVCGDDIPEMRAKPQPDIFLVAAREVLGRDVGFGEATEAQLAVRAKGLVFEDALSGLQAGKRAGMNVVWVPDDRLRTLAYDEVEKPDLVLRSLEEFVPEEWGLPPYDYAY